MSDISVSKSWPPDNYSPVQHKLCFITTSSFPYRGCLILTSFVVCTALSSLFSAWLRGDNQTGILFFAFNSNGSCNFVFTGRETPSVAGIINPGSEGFQKLFFGQEEIAIPVHATYGNSSLLAQILGLFACSQELFFFFWVVS